MTSRQDTLRDVRLDEVVSERATDPASVVMGAPLDGVSHVDGMGTPPEICEPVVGGIAVKMSRFHPFRTRTGECLKDKMVDESGSRADHVGLSTEMDLRIASFILMGAQQRSDDRLRVASPPHNSTGNTLYFSVVADHVGVFVPKRRAPMFTHDRLSHVRLPSSRTGPRVVRHRWGTLRSIILLDAIPGSTHERQGTPGS